MFRKSIIMFVGLVGATATFAQDTTAYTLQQCVDVAIKNNFDVKKAEYMVQSNDAYLTQAKAGLFPSISAAVSHGFNQGRSINPYTNSYIDQTTFTGQYNLNAGVVLWNGSSLQSNIRQNSLTYQASQKDLEQAKNDLTISVILAYLQVLSNQDQLTLAKRQASVTRQQVERLTILDKDGNIAPATLYDQKGQLGTDELNIIATKNAIETAKLTLVQLMNIPYSPNMKLQAINKEESLVLYGETVDDVALQASQQYALVKAAELRRESAEANVKTLKGQMYPTLSINGSLGTNYSNAATTEQYINTVDVATKNYVISGGNKLSVYTPQDNFQSQNISYGSQWTNNLNSYIGLALQIPIFNGLRLRSQVKLAKITAAQVTYQQKTINTKLRQSIDQAYVNMRTSFERYQTLDQQVKDYETSFKAATVKFDAGVITSVDYIIAKNNYDAATTNLIVSKYDYILKTKILDYYQGKLAY